MADTYPIAALSREDKELVMLARMARSNAYAPYSNFGVGAAVRAVDGKTYLGANLENASYGLGLCAEVAALTAANTAGARQLESIAVFGAPLDGPAQDQVATPCGRCRQLILEAAHVAGRNVRVLSVSQDGNYVRIASISELLPDAFGPADLGLVEVPRSAKMAQE